MRFDVTGKAMCVLSFPTVPGSEAIIVPLQVADSVDSQAVQMSDIIIVFDMSRSLKGEAIVAAKRTTSKFVEDNVQNGGRVAIVGLGMPIGDGFGVGTALPFTTDVKKAVAAIDGFEALGNTPMAAAIRHAETLCEKGVAVVLFSDGYATDEGVKEAANSLKKVAELFTIAIGESADQKLLESIATSPDHYFPVSRADELKIVYEDINTLLYKGESKDKLPDAEIDNKEPDATEDDSPSPDKESGWDDDDDDASAWEEVA